MSSETEAKLRIHSAQGGEGADSVPLAEALSTGDLLAEISSLLETAAVEAEKAAAPEPVQNTSIAPRAPRRAPPPAPRPKADRRQLRARLLRLALVLVAACVVSPLLSEHSGGHAYTIASDSMEPTMPKGSLVFTHDGVPALHDVVVYESRFTGTLQVHRIIEVRGEGAETTYVARGDHNDAPDSFVVTPADIRGIVSFNVPEVGHLWLMPAVLQGWLFIGFLTAYLGIVAWDARARIGRRLGPAFGVLAVLLLVAPAAFGGTIAAFPGSNHTVDITSGPVPMTAGSAGSAVITDSGNGATATVESTTGGNHLWKEFPMWGGDATAYTLSVTSTSYTTVASSLTHVDVSKFLHTPTFFLEASLRAASSQNISVKLYDKTNSVYVAGAVLSTTSTTDTLVRSSTGFALSGATEYQFRVLVSGGTGVVEQVKILSVQTDPTKVQTQVRVASFFSTTYAVFTESNASARWKYDASNLDGVAAVYFETVGSQASAQGTAQARLVKSDGTVIATNSMTTTLTRTRSADIKASLTDGATYWVEYKANSGASRGIDLYQARIVIEQSAFTKTINYLDVTARTTTTSTSYAELGYEVRLPGDTEYAGTQYFEATLQQSDAGNTAGARAYDNLAAAVVAGSTVTNVGTTKTLVRSSAVTYNAANATYKLQGSASAGTTTIYNAWLLSFVTVSDGSQKLLKDFTMWGGDATAYALSVTSTSYTTVASSITHVDPSKFDPVPTFYLEATLKAASSQNISVKLYDKTNSVHVTGAVLSTTSTSSTLVRSSTGFALSGATEYQFRVLVSGGTGVVDQVRLVSSQTAPVTAQTQVRVASFFSTTYAVFTESNASARWKYDASNLDGVAAVYFETVGSQASAQGTAQARLVKSDGTVIATNSMTTTLTRTRSADIKASLTDGATYWVEYKANSGASRGIDLYQARIVIEQSAFTKTINYVDLAPRTTTTSTSYADLGYEARLAGNTEYPAVQYFEATVQQSGAGNTAGARAYDNLAAAVVTDSTITNVGTTKTLVRSSAVTYNAGNATYKLQGSASAGTTTIFGAWLLSFVTITEPSAGVTGGTFDHVLRTTPSVSPSCTWTFRLAQASDSNTGRLSSFTLRLRGDGTVEDQIVFSGGSYSQTTGTAVSVTQGTRLEHIVVFTPNAAGSSSVTGNVLGTCGGLHTTQRVIYEID